MSVVRVILDALLSYPNYFPVPGNVPVRTALCHESKSFEAGTCAVVEPTRKRIPWYVQVRS